MYVEQSSVSDGASDGKRCVHIILRTETFNSMLRVHNNGRSFAA